MDKGVSQVISTIILILISVVAAIGVWYWAVQLADKPVRMEEEQARFTVQECEIGGDNEYATLTVRNTGTLLIDSSSVTVENRDGAEVTYIDFTQAKHGVLEPEEVAFIEIEHSDGKFEEGGEYTVADEEFPLRKFICE